MNSTHSFSWQFKWFPKSVKTLWIDESMKLTKMNSTKFLPIQYMSIKVKYMSNSYTVCSPQGGTYMIRVTERTYLHVDLILMTTSSARYFHLAPLLKCWKGKQHLRSWHSLYVDNYTLHSLHLYSYFYNMYMYVCVCVCMCG